jgi:hypothetical protein
MKTPINKCSNNTQDKIPQSPQIYSELFDHLQHERVKKWASIQA